MSKGLVYLKVPKSYFDQFNTKEQPFPVKSGIPIPVLIDDEKKENEISNLSMDMIISGMLQVIEEKQVKQEWINYYCDFVLFLCPDVIDKLKEIKGLENSDNDYEIANNFFKEGRAEEGLPYIRNYIEKNPKTWKGWFALGWGLRLLGRWQDAISALKKALENGGTELSDIKNELAICLIELGETNEAKKELESALSVDEQNIKILSNLGVRALKTNNKEEANCWFKKVLEIDKDDPLAKQFLKM